MFIHTRGMVSLDSSLREASPRSVQNDRLRAFLRSFKMTEGCGCSGRRGVASLDSSLATLVQNDREGGSFGMTGKGVRFVRDDRGKEIWRALYAR